MKKNIAFLLLLFFGSITPCFADTQEPVPDNLARWEQENAAREQEEEGKYGALWDKTLMLLIVVMLILFVGTWYLKKFGTANVKDAGKDARIQLIEKRVLSPKAVVYLLSIDGHKIALSETSSGVQLLGEIKNPIS